MINLLIKIDELLTELENVVKGELGDKITNIRKIIRKYIV